MSHVQTLITTRGHDNRGIGSSTRRDAHHVVVNDRLEPGFSKLMSAHRSTTPASRSEANYHPRPKPIEHEPQTDNSDAIKARRSKAAMESADFVASVYAMLPQPKRRS